MKISDIDGNFKIESSVGLDDVVFFDVKDAPFSVHGIFLKEKGKRFLRMPAEVAKATSDDVAWNNECTAGGRIRFRTDSPYIAIKAVMPASPPMPHMTRLGQSGFDVYISDKGKCLYSTSLIPSFGQPGFETYKPTDGKMHTYTIYMPLYDAVDEVYIGLARGSELESAEEYGIKKPFLYYGSSITQGGCASRPGNAYQAMISRRFDADFVNLGFSGSAKGEKAMREYLATLDCTVFICDFDHNAQSGAELEATHRPLYEAYRNLHPDTPIVFVSRPDFYPVPEDIKRREVVIATYEYALSAGDKKVLFVDGKHLFDGEFADSCTVDGCHPNDLGFFRMAQKIGDVIEEALKMM